MNGCFHCGLPLPPGVALTVAIEGVERPMCCHGCEAVARTIVDAGRGDFYRRRTTAPLSPARPVPGFPGGDSPYDNPDVQAKFVESGEDGASRVSLTIDGTTCSACAWLIEHTLKSTPGIVDAGVNYNTRRAIVTWRPQEVRLSDILRRVHEIGYRAQPFDPAVHQDAARRERRSFPLRIGVASALGMRTWRG